MKDERLKTLVAITEIINQNGDSCTRINAIALLINNLIKKDEELTEIVARMEY